MKRRKFTKYPVMAASKGRSWKSVQHALMEAYEEAEDPFYELFTENDTIDYILKICWEVDASCGLELEASVQAGQGTIFVRNANDDVLGTIDFSGYDEEIGELVLNSNSASDFKSKYKAYLEDLEMEEVRPAKQASSAKSDYSEYATEYANKGFNYFQLHEIGQGIAEGLDVSIYADPKFNSSQMSAIRGGLEQGLDVSWYADPKFDAFQMLWICAGLEKGLDVSQYADPKYDEFEMKEIYEQLLSESK